MPKVGSVRRSITPKFVTPTTHSKAVGVTNLGVMLLWVGICVRVALELTFTYVDHRSMTPKSVTPTAPSCIHFNSLSQRQKLTSSTANLKWCHVHFICDSFITRIRRVSWPSKDAIDAKFDFISTSNHDSTTSHHKHLICQYPTEDTEKLNNVWPDILGTNRIIDK